MSHSPPDDEWAFNLFIFPALFTLTIYSSFSLKHRVGNIGISGIWSRNLWFINPTLYHSAIEAGRSGILFSNLCFVNTTLCHSVLEAGSSGIWSSNLWFVNTMLYHSAIDACSGICSSSVCIVSQKCCHCL